MTSVSGTAIKTYGCIMRQPPLFSTVRINTRNIDVTEAKLELERRFSVMSETAQFMVEIHSDLPDLLIIAGSGPHSMTPNQLEIYVDRACGNSISRGAQLYARGILGSNKGFSIGNSCSIWMDVERNCLKGRCQPFQGPKVFLGNGVLQFDRKQVFNPSNLAPDGIGVLINEPIWKHPSFSDIISDWGFLQNLPSVLCGHVLDPKPGEIVLDMCAAPGGKTTHIAQLMENTGKIIALDQNAERVRLLKQNVECMKMGIIEVFKFNATKTLYQSNDDKQVSNPPFLPETFDRILVDAPCSATGQRDTL